nr:immunoglobulin light chain junction region [Macaca mulatta]
CQHGYGAPYTF